MTLYQKLEIYADSVDSDINTIDNFELNCCDFREREVLVNVFDNLEKMLYEYRQSRQSFEDDIVDELEKMDSDEVFDYIQDNIRSRR